MPDVVLLALRRHHVGLILKRLQSVVALSQIVERGYAVNPVLVYLTAADKSRLQLSVLRYHEVHATAYGLTSGLSHLFKQFLHLVTLQRKETYLVLKRRHVQHITYRHIALRQRRTYAAHIVNGEVGLLSELAAAPQQYVGQQIRQVALRSRGSHVVGSVAHNRTHHAVNLSPVRRKKSHSGTVGHRIIAAVYHHPLALDTRKLHAGRTCRKQQYGRQHSDTECASAHFSVHHVCCHIMCVVSGQTSPCTETLCHRQSAPVVSFTKLMQLSHSAKPNELFLHVKVLTKKNNASLHKLPCNISHRNICSYNKKSIYFRKCHTVNRNTKNRKHKINHRPHTGGIKTNNETTLNNNTGRKYNDNKCSPHSI